MTPQSILRPRSARKRPRQRVGAAFVQAATAGGAAPDFPMDFHEPDEGKSTLATGSISAAIHFGAIGLLFLFAALNPEIIEEIIPVRLLREEAPKTPAPARRALAERRKLEFAPAMQTVQPQIINKRVIANAAPAINAEMLQMDSLNAAAAPTQVKRSAIDVDRVSAIGAIGGYQASKVEVNQAAGPAVRGPDRSGRTGRSFSGPAQSGRHRWKQLRDRVARDQPGFVGSRWCTHLSRCRRLAHWPRSRQRRHGRRRGKPQRSRVGPAPACFRTAPERTAPSGPKSRRISRCCINGSTHAGPCPTESKTNA